MTEMPTGHHDLGCQCWPHVSQAELDAMTEDRDHWRDVAVALADLHNKVGKALVEQNVTMKFDGRDLRTALAKQMLIYNRRNPQVQWTRPDKPITS